MQLTCPYPSQKPHQRLDGYIGSRPTTGRDYFVHDSIGASGSDLALSFTKVGTAAATLEHRYLHGPAGQVLVDEVFNASGQSTDSLWMLADHQGTPRDIVDDNGVLRKHVDYDSFGQITGEQFYARNGTSITTGHAEAVEQLFGNTGQERDAATGLKYHAEGEEGRWYDPSIGRWLSEDLVFAPNLYPYAGNDPINTYDPTGKFQQGNPLNNLFGGYSGGKAEAAKPISTAVASGLSLGTLGTVVGNAVYNAASVYAPTVTPLVAGAAKSIASSFYSPGTYGPLPSTLNSQVVADLRNQGRVTSLAEGVLVIRYSDAQGNDKKALVEQHVFGSGKGHNRTTFEVINTAPISVTDKNLAEIIENQWFINNVNDFVAGTNVATAATPFVNDARDVIELYNGRDAIYPEQRLTGWNYGLTVGAAILPVVSGRFLRAIFGTSEAVVDTANATRHEVATGTIAELRAAGTHDAHHVIQDASVRELPRYNTNAAPGVQLPGRANVPGTNHYIATQIQRQAGGGTYAAERRIAYKALRYAGFDESDARKLIQQADDYFSGLGVTPSTKTRIPGDRAK